MLEKIHSTNDTEENHNNSIPDGEAATLSTYALEQELEKRNRSNVFPLDVFNPKIKPFVNDLHQYMDLPRSYIGLSMLSAWSSAIGTGYALRQGSNTMYLPVWACLEGISSSGKSLAIDSCLKPLYQFQENFDKEWGDTTHGLSREKAVWERLQTCVYRDAHIQTLVRYVMPDNPKGVLKISDEIMEWINGMNQTSRKEGTDEQFWLSAWNARNYSGIRAMKDKFVLPRVFVNVIGGIQPSITWKLFQKDRDTTGFIFRLLFAVPEEVRIAEPNIQYLMPEQLKDIHHQALKSLYYGLKIDDAYEDPRYCEMSPKASRAHHAWKKEKTIFINNMKEVREKEIHSGILGKMSEYAMRFAAILHIADRAYDKQDFHFVETISGDTMERALKLADYFYKSAAIVYDRVNQDIIAPPEVLRFASYVRAGYTFTRIGEMEWPRKGEDAGRKMAARMVKQMMQKYPKVFNANAK